MNAWFVIRTAPGAQHPQREYAVETTRSVKGYRIVPSLDPDVSAVERSLSQNGFAHYMPTERRLVRDRRRTNLWTTRRFPMLQGYAFVRDVHDFRLLEATAGVVDVIRNNGEPFVMPIMDIRTLEDIEEANAAEVTRQLDRLTAIDLAKASRVTRSSARLLFPTHSHIEITGGPLLGKMAFVTGQGRDGRLKAIADGLDALGSISLPIEMVRLVA